MKDTIASRFAVLIHNPFVFDGVHLYYMSSLQLPYTPSRQLRSVSLKLLSQPRINILLPLVVFDMLALHFGIPSLIISDLPTLTLSSNPIQNLPFLWCKHLRPLAIYIHALLILHNQVDFCVLKLYYVMLCALWTSAQGVHSDHSQASGETAQHYASHIVLMVSCMCEYFKLFCLTSIVGNGHSTFPTHTICIYESISQTVERLNRLFLNAEGPQFHKHINVLVIQSQCLQNIDSLECSRSVPFRSHSPNITFIIIL